MSGIRDRAGLRSLVDANITDGSASITPADHRAVEKSLTDSLVVYGEQVVRVIDMTTTTPPGTPADRDAYVVAATATGAWTGWENDIAVWDAQAATPAWVRVPRFDGMLVLNLADDLIYRWDGSGAAWVQTDDPDTIKNNETATLTVGYTHTVSDQGTKSSGSFIPAAANGAMQKITNGGAFTLAPPANNTSILLKITNNATAGAITTTGFTKVTGDAFTTTDGHKFVCNLDRIDGETLLHVRALQ